MQALGYPLTYPVRCRQCGERVFLHTNGNGDLVIFDHLGWPWPIHPCYGLYVGGLIREDPASYRARMVAKYGRPAPKPGKSRLGWTSLARPSGQKPRVRDPREIQPRSPKPEDIVRYDPQNNSAHLIQVSGTLHALHCNRTVRKLSAGKSLLSEAYFEALGGTTHTQITVVDADLVSYTALLPVPEIVLPLGTLIVVRLERVQVLDVPLLICRSLEVVEIDFDS